MAGKGFAPRTADNVRVFTSEPATQPALPDWHDWHPATLEWWSMWGRFPLACDFTEADWSFLIDTALMQDAYYRGELKHAAEIRLRVAKFGQTVEDRARLKVVFAAGDAAEEKSAAIATSAAERRKARLHAVGE